jgi:hypothetical protein
VIKGRRVFAIASIGNKAHHKAGLAPVFLCAAFFDSPSLHPSSGLKALKQFRFSRNTAAARQTEERA